MWSVWPGEAVALRMSWFRMPVLRIATVSLRRPVGGGRSVWPRGAYVGQTSAQPASPGQSVVHYLDRCVEAGPELEADGALVDQHSQAVHCLRSAPPGLREEGGHWCVNYVAHDHAGHYRVIRYLGLLVDVWEESDGSGVDYDCGVVRNRVRAGPCGELDFGRHRH